MKNVFMLLLAMFSVVIAVNAQNQDRERERLQEYCMLKDGQMYICTNQDRKQLREQLKLQDGTMVNPDGTYQLRNGKQRQLRDGQCLDMYGKRFRSEERFMQKMEQRRMDGMQRDPGGEKMKQGTRRGQGRGN